MNSSDRNDTDALTKQLAEIDRLQRELSQQLRERQEPAAPVAPWLARRGTSQGTSQRATPPWLARRGRQN